VSGGDDLDPAIGQIASPAVELQPRRVLLGGRPIPNTLDMPGYEAANDLNVSIRQRQLLEVS
jgi:hypothetical protein